MTVTPFNSDFGDLLAIAGDTEALQQVHGIEVHLLQSHPPLARLDDLPVRVAANQLRIATNSDDALGRWEEFLWRQRQFAACGKGLPPAHLSALAVCKDVVQGYFEQAQPIKLQVAQEAEVAKRALLQGRLKPSAVVRPSIDRRSLQGLNENGLEVVLDASRISSGPRPEDPMLLHLRYQRIATINGHPDSYVNHVIHDSVDHWAALNLLERSDLVQRFNGLFNQLGNPQGSNIFSLEGEVLASQIFYLWRNMHNTVRTVPAGVTLDQLQTVFARQRDQGQLTPNQAAADQILAGLDPYSEEARQLEIIYPGTLVELIAFQRRRGRVSRFNKDREKIGQFSLDDPEYLAFTVFCNRILMTHRSFFQNVLLNVNVRIEDHLRHKKDKRLIITAEDLEKPLAQTVAEVNVPTNVVRWFQQNLFRTGLNEDRSVTLSQLRRVLRTGSYAIKAI